LFNYSQYSKLGQAIPAGNGLKNQKRKTNAVYLEIIQGTMFDAGKN
jgi:hypothetical protein